MELEEFGAQISQIREEIRENVTSLNKMSPQMVDAKLEEVDRLHTKMSRFEVRQNRGRRDDPENEWREPCAFMLNRQKKRKAALTLTDKINIAYKVLIEYDKI